MAAAPSMLDIARVAASVNVLLLCALVVVWGRHYLALRSTHTLGTTVFALALLFGNVLALYYYLVLSSMTPPVIEAMMLLQVLETAGIVFLIYVTCDVSLLLL